jgi:hypothetical protein
MVDKRRACGGTCLRCWRNKLKHGSKEAKAWLKKNGQKIEIVGEVEPTESKRCLG